MDAYIVVSAQLWTLILNDPLETSEAQEFIRRFDLWSESIWDKLTMTCGAALNVLPKSIVLVNVCFLLHLPKSDLPLFIRTAVV